MVQVCRLLGEDESAIDDDNSPVSGRILFSFIRDEYSTLTQRARFSHRKELLTFKNFNLISSESGLTNCRWMNVLGNLVGVTQRERQDDDDYPRQDEWTVRLKDWRENKTFWNSDKFDIGIDGRIRIIDRSFSSSAGYRLWYSPNKSLHAGQLVSGTSTQLVFPVEPEFGSTSPIDGAYVGESVLIDSGAALGQVGVITGYVGATRTATIESAYGVDEGLANAPGPAQYSLLPWFPVEYHKLICYLVVMSLAPKFSTALDHTAKMNDLLRRYDTWLSRSDLFTPRKVFNSGNVRSGAMGLPHGQRGNDIIR